MDQFDRDSTIADFKNGVTKLMVRNTKHQYTYYNIPTSAEIASNYQLAHQKSQA